MKSQITAFARAGNNGGRRASGSFGVAAACPGVCSIEARASEPKPRPVCCKNWRREGSAKPPFIEGLNMRKKGDRAAGKTEMQVAKWNTQVGKSPAQIRRRKTQRSKWNVQRQESKMPRQTRNAPRAESKA